MKLVFLAAALSLVGCANSDNDIVFFTAYEGALVKPAQEAAAAWNACGKKFVVVNDPGDRGIPIYFETNHKTNGETNWWPDGPKGVEVSREANDPESTLEHEFGHVLIGFDHFGNGVMNGTPNRAVHVTEEDCDRL